MKAGRMMVRLLLAVILVSPAGPASAAGGPPVAGAVSKFRPYDPPRPAPEVGFQDADGATIMLSALAGKTVLVNFWATWCAPCIRELPSLARLQVALGGEGFAVQAISLDRGGAAVHEPFLRKLLGSAALRSGSDRRGRLARAMGAPGLPASYLLNEGGQVVGELIGPAEWDSAEARALIGHYLP